MSNSIPKFPADIDRDAFGHWLSGFTDGEGHFCLRMRGSIPRAWFGMYLRDDDHEILAHIQSFMGVGSIYRVKKRGPSNPQVGYQVYVISELANVVVPHFEKYPLRAKKIKRL